MGKRYWSADIHANHANIAKHCNRPWLRDGDLTPERQWTSREAAIACAVRMNDGIVHEFNMRVRPEDDVVHIGDFATNGKVQGVEGIPGGYRPFLARLNGTWILLEGNHDPQGKVKTVGRHMISKIGPLIAFVSHYPTESITHSPSLIDWVYANCDLALCGHVHDSWDHKWIGPRGFLNINVGVDVRKFRPMTDQEIIVEHARLVRERKK